MYTAIIDPIHTQECGTPNAKVGGYLEAGSQTCHKSGRNNLAPQHSKASHRISKTNIVALESSVYNQSSGKRHSRRKLLRLGEMRKECVRYVCNEMERSGAKTWSSRGLMCL